MTETLTLIQMLSKEYQQVHVLAALNWKNGAKYKKK
jgi:hypothetical protein